MAMNKIPGHDIYIGGSVQLAPPAMIEFCRAAELPMMRGQERQ